MKILSESELLRVAQIIDMRAVFRVRHSDGRAFPGVSVNGYDPDVHWLAEITGVTVEKGRRWLVFGMRAAIVLMNVQPLLHAQRDTAEEMIELARGIRYLGSTANEMALLGWKMPYLSPHPKPKVPLLRELTA